VRALLIQDRGINALNVNVTTDEGEVFLIGRVVDRSARLKAEDYARSVAGVWSVINHLKVGVPADKKSYSADLKLRQNVESRILRDQNVLGFNIQVLVHESEIYLLGRVKNDNERQQAVNVARETAGVRGVHNYLKAGRLQKEESS
jgi:osmotically-inducible protein OsmY